MTQDWKLEWDPSQWVIFWHHGPGFERVWGHCPHVNRKVTALLTYDGNPRPFAQVCESCSRSIWASAHAGSRWTCELSPADLIILCPDAHHRFTAAQSSVQETE